MLIRDEKPAFPWLVTPNFFFCFLLLLCMFVPGFKSCNNQTVYIGKGFVTPAVGFTNLSQILAIIVLVATWLWCIAPETEKRDIGSKFAWRSFFVLTVANCLLTSGVLLYSAASENSDSRSPPWSVIVFLIGFGAYLALPMIVSFITFKRVRSPFFKASVMQFVLSLAGIASTLYFLPLFCLAGKFYIGGKLNVIGVFGLLFMSVVQLIDGERALNRKHGEPVVRLTLKQSFLLMTIACVLCSLAIGLFVVEPPTSLSNPKVEAVGLNEQ